MLTRLVKRFYRWRKWHYWLKANVVIKKTVIGEDQDGNRVRINYVLILKTCDLCGKQESMRCLTDCFVDGEWFNTKGIGECN